jgi:hypothetical protein
MTTSSRTSCSTRSPTAAPPRRPRSPAAWRRVRRRQYCKKIPRAEGDSGSAAPSVETSTGAIAAPIVQRATCLGPERRRSPAAASMFARGGAPPRTLSTHDAGRRSSDRSSAPSHHGLLRPLHDRFPGRFSPLGLRGTRGVPNARVTARTHGIVPESHEWEHDALQVFREEVRRTATP